jgi:gluconolactonase
MSRELERFIAPHAVPEKVAGGLGLARGPVFSRRGYLLFSDTEASKIMKWEQGKVSVFRGNSNGASGLTFDHQGRLVACERQCVIRTEKDGKITVLADGLYAPGDVVYAIDGSIYFSSIASTPGSSAIHQITRNGEVRVASRDCKQPGGVALAPNQQKLYAADTSGRKIWVYEIAGDGALRGGRVFAPALTNGLKTDEMGNVWAADGHSIAVFDAHGQRLGEISMPEDPSNCAWGDGFRNLYVTAKTSVYRIETKVNGTRTY